MLGVDTARPHADEYILTPSVADPASENDLDHIVSTCPHPGIQIVRFPNGETSHHCTVCTVCAKTWGSLEEAVDEARVAQREAKDATARRNKAMEDAARAAAAAFDAGIEAERNPVKLDGDRKLKAI